MPGSESASPSSPSSSESSESSESPGASLSIGAVGVGVALGLDFEERCERVLE